jgi:hypothetical protein
MIKIHQSAWRAEASGRRLLACSVRRPAKSRARSINNQLSTISRFNPAQPCATPRNPTQPFLRKKKILITMTTTTTQALHSAFPWPVLSAAFSGIPVAPVLRSRSVANFLFRFLEQHETRQTKDLKPFRILNFTIQPFNTLTNQRTILINPIYTPPRSTHEKTIIIQFMSKDRSVSFVSWRLGGENLRLSAKSADPASLSTFQFNFQK